MDAQLICSTNRRSSSVASRFGDDAVDLFDNCAPLGFAGRDTNLYRYVGNDPTNKVDPTGLIDQGAFWAGAVLSAKATGLPVLLLQWAKDKDLSISEGASTGYSKFWNSITYGDSTQTRRNERIGRAGKFNPTTDRGSLGTLYNEVFHAWFDQCLENNKLKGAWLWSIIKGQTQFGDDHVHKAEEAMSEMISQVINALETGTPIPTYDEILKMGARSEWRHAITPGHNEPEEKWAGDVGASKEMTEELYYATLWLLEHGFDNCLPHRKPGSPGATSPLIAGLDDGDILFELKKYFATKYRPKWTPQEISDFTKTTRKEIVPPWRRKD